MKPAPSTSGSFSGVTSASRTAFPSKRCQASSPATKKKSGKRSRLVACADQIRSSFHSNQILEDSLCFLCVLCVSMVNDGPTTSTTETQRTQRKLRERTLDSFEKRVRHLL